MRALVVLVVVAGCVTPHDWGEMMLRAEAEAPAHCVERVEHEYGEVEWLVYERDSAHTAEGLVVVRDAFVSDGKRHEVRCVFADGTVLEIDVE